MKNLIIFISILFTFSISLFAQENKPCPKISVIAPNDLIRFGEEFTFTAKIEGINLDNIKYFWKTDTGKIIEGQGTSILKMTGEPGSTVTAIVEITGLPENCLKSASSQATIFTYCPVQSIKLAEYSLPLPRIFKAQLDAMFIALNNDKSAIGYIFERFKPNDSASLIQRKISQTLSYIRIRRIPLEQIKIFIATDDKNLTELWIKPFAADAPPFENVTNPIEITPQNYKRELAKLFPLNQKISTLKTKKN